jgi:parallel beta-helix repeat protein
LACTGCATGITTGQGLVTQNSAEIRGQIATDTAGPVEYWFEYGPTAAYGSESPHVTWPYLAPGDRGEVGFKLEGLSRSTTYHYRVCAKDSTQKGGPGCGEDRTVKTQSFACGETVTADVRFTGSVVCQTLPPGASGLVIGAPGITIDLHGYNLQGPSASRAAAIDNSGGFDDVTVRGIDNVGMYSGSTLAGFPGGVHLENASGNRVLYVRTSVDLSGGSGNEVRHSFLNGEGLRARNTSGLVVADNVADFGPIDLSGLLDSRVVRNSMHPPYWWFCCEHAIRLAGNRNVIKENSVSGWAGGLVLLSGADNKLLDNTVFETHLAQTDPYGVDGDGIFVGAFTAGTILRGNLVHDNEGDGIDVHAAETRITDNGADDNGDFGIDAVPGVTDGGGNSASGNGNPLGCRNVACAASP